VPERIGELGEQLLARPRVLAFSSWPGKGGVLFGTVLLDGVNRCCPLLNGGDGDVGVLGRFCRFLDSLRLVWFEVFFNRDLIVSLDVERMVAAELVLSRAADNRPSDPEPVGESSELDVCNLKRNEEVFTLAAGVPHTVVVALNPSGGVAFDPVARFEHVSEVPEVVDVLGDECEPLAALLAIAPLGDAHVVSFGRGRINPCHPDARSERQSRWQLPSGSCW